MSRLEGLTHYLSKLPDDAVILTFDEIEVLMGTRLPRSARKANSPFWATTSRNVYAKAWADAGFVTSFDDCGPNEVLFARAGWEGLDGDGPGAATDRPDETPAAAPPPPPNLSSLPPPPVSAEDHAAAVARELSANFDASSFFASARGQVEHGWETLPDVVVARALEARGADPVWIRLLLTFGALIDRGRGDADRWNAVADAFDREVSLFDPDGVLAMSLRDLSGALSSAGVTTKVTEVAAWRLLAEAIADQSPDAPLPAVVYDGKGDAARLVDEITGIPGFANRRTLIRWVRMMVFPGGAELDRTDALPVVVDADVRRATEFLGVAATGGLPLTQARQTIEAAWQAAVAAGSIAGPPGLAGTALALDQSLKYQGAVGCGWCRRKLVLEPFTPSCGGCKLKTS